MVFRSVVHGSGHFTVHVILTNMQHQAFIQHFMITIFINQSCAKNSLKQAQAALHVCTDQIKTASPPSDNRCFTMYSANTKEDIVLFSVFFDQ